MSFNKFKFTFSRFTSIEYNSNLMNAGIKSSCRYGAKRMFPIDFRNGISFVFLLTDFIDFPRHLSIHFPIIDSVFQSYCPFFRIIIV